MTYKTGDKVKLEGTVKDTLAEGRLLVEIAGAGIIVPSCRVIPESVLTEDEAADYRAGDFATALEPTANVALLSVAENVEIKRAFEAGPLPTPEWDEPKQPPAPTGERYGSVEEMTDAIGVPFSAVADEAEKEPVAEKPKRGRKKAE